jgi:hypothetical protein
MCKVDGWQMLATKPIGQPNELAASNNMIMLPDIAPHRIPTTPRAASIVTIYVNVYISMSLV